MKVTARQYAQALYDLTVDAADAKLVVKSFATYLVSKQSVSLLPDIISNFEKIWSKEQGLAVSKIRSAHPLTKETEQLIKDYLVKILKKPQLSLETEVDSNLLGGFVAECDNQILDASLQNNLKRLHAELQA